MLAGKLNLLMKNCKEILKLVWKGFAYESIANELGFSVKYVNKMKTLCTQELMKLIMNDPRYNTLIELFTGVVPG